MVIHKWDYDDLFSDNFWKNVILYNSRSAVKRMSDDIKDNSKNLIDIKITDDDIKLLWNTVLNDIQEIYFHGDYQLFKYWINNMKKTEIQTVIKLIHTYKSWAELEDFILKSSSYPDMLEYAEEKYLGVEQEDNDNEEWKEWNTEITFTSFLNKLHKYPVLMFVSDMQIMLSGTNKDDINDAYFQLLQSGYKYVDKIMYQSKFLTKPTDIYIFELSTNMLPDYLSLS